MTVPDGERGYALGLLQSVVPAAGLIGPLLGGVLADLIGYRAIFYVVGSVCVTGGIVAAATLKETRTTGHAMVAVSVRDNLGVAWRHADLRRALLAMVASQTFITSLQPIFVLYVEQLGVEARLLSTTTGVLFAATGITALVAAPWWGRRGDRLGYRGVLTVSLLGSAVLLFLQALVTGVVQLFVLRLLYGCFVAGVLPPLLGLHQRRQSRRPSRRPHGPELQRHHARQSVRPADGRIHRGPRRTAPRLLRLRRIPLVVNAYARRLSAARATNVLDLGMR